jgi:thioredoxin 2
MSGEVRHIVCPHCNSVNRVPKEKDLRDAKCGRCHQPIFNGRPLAASAESFATHIRHNDIPVVVDFWAQWCGPCKAMTPTYERVASELEPEFRFLKVDTEAAPELASRYNVRNIPTLILFQNGAEVARQAGAMDASSLRSWLRQHAAGSFSALQAG